MFLRKLHRITCTVFHIEEGTRAASLVGAGHWAEAGHRAIAAYIIHLQHCLVLVPVPQHCYQQRQSACGEPNTAATPL
jgi:hypothetical protein